MFLDYYYNYIYYKIHLFIWNYRIYYKATFNFLNFKSFKQRYKFFCFINNNNLLDFFNLNKKIAFIIVYNLLNRRFSIFRYNRVNKKDLVIIMLLFKKFSNKYKNIIELNKSKNIILEKKNFNFLIENILEKKIKIIKILNNNVIKLANFLYNNNNNNFYFNNLNLNLLNIDCNLDFLNNLKKIYSISFSSTNLIKYLSNLTNNKIIILFLRKNKIFNKSRYSRNRQTYRSGVYWCLYINIIAIIAFYFWFYKFTINFGYMWWFIFIFLFNFFFPRSLKYKFYNIFNLIKELKIGILWYFNIIWLCLKPINIESIISNLFYSYFIRVLIIRYFIYWYFTTNIYNFIIKNYKINIYHYYCAIDFYQFKTIYKYVINFYYTLLKYYN